MKKNGGTSIAKNGAAAATIYWAFFAAIVTFCIFNVFSGIGAAPIFDWDEARHGISAYEMIRDGNYIAHTFLGERDYWNLKPPLSFWSIAASFHLFGLNAFALRFFSALSLVAIVVTAMLFFKKYYSLYAGLVSGLLFSAVGVQMNHLFLHGDADALFYLFYFLAVLCFCQAYLSSEKYLIGSGLCIAFAFLTKASHAAVPGMVIMLSAFLLRKTKKVPIKSWLLFWIFPMAVPVFLWAAMRYSVDGTAFFERMVLVDILQRASTGLEGNQKDAFYYIRELARVLGPFLLNICIISVCLVLGGLASKKLALEDSDKIIAVAGISAAVVPILFFSLMKTKLSWYVWPSTIGFVFISTWIIYYTWKRHVSIKRLKKESVLWPSVMTFYCAFLAVALMAMPDHKAMQYYYDTSTMYPERSVFYELPAIENTTWSAIDQDGKQKDPSQSWILHGIFSGYEYHRGTLQEFYDNQETDYLFVTFNSADGIEAFDKSNPTLQGVYKQDLMAVYAKKGTL